MANGSIRKTMTGAGLAVSALAIGAGTAVAQDGRWTGAYAGVQFAYGDFDSDAVATGDADGLIGGVHAGYNWDLGTWVWGVEASYDFADAEFDGGGRIDEIGRFGLRLGRDFGQSLVYGTIGVTRAKATAGGVRRSENGWFLGAGLDHDIGGNWLVGGRILYSSFSDLAGSGNDVDGVMVEARASFRF